MKQLLITLTIGIIALTGCENKKLSHCNDCDFKDSLLVDFMSYVSQFTDYSFVDWEDISSMSVKQYVADWDESLDDNIHPSWKQEGLDAEVWNLLKNAKAEVHRRSIPLRSISSRRLCRKLDALERAFDEAFEQMVTQEYYLRCFEDVFDEMIPPKVDNLCR
jgi:hypothetical protein